MTALLYKDLFLLLRQLRWFLLAVLALLLLPLTLFFQQAQLSLVPLIGLLVPIQLAACDEQTHWDHYARMLPYHPRDTVLSRYLISWATTLVGGGLCLARSSLTSPDHHLSPAMLGTIGWLVAAVLLAQAVELPLLFRISVVHGQLWSLLVLLAAILLALNLLADLNPNNPYAVLPLLLPGLLRAAPLALLAGAVANGISVALSLRLVAQPTP